MSFLHPEFFYYMFVPIVVFFGFLIIKKFSNENYFSEEIMQKLRVESGSMRLKSRNILFFIVALLILGALSEPVMKEGTIQIKAKSADIIVALDISDSMLAEDMYPNRLKLAKKKSLELLALAPTQRVGIIGFAKNSYLVSPLSFDHAAVAFLLKALSTDSITEKGTDFLSMLEVVDRTIKKDAQRYLLILSDGGDNDDFSQEIAFAKEKNIVIFVLGMGTKKGAPIKQSNGSFIKYQGDIVVSKLNEKIATLATSTGGVYIQSMNSGADMKKMLQEIESHSVKKELKSQEIKRYKVLFYYPLALAIVLLLIATSSLYRTKGSGVIVALMFMLLSNGTLKAGLLDFVELNHAQEAYEKKEFHKSAQIYAKYLKNTDNNEVKYNRANALYKAGKYKEAIHAYKNASFSNKFVEAKNLANLGNAYVKSKEKKSLEHAVSAYEESLQLQEDKNTRENLEAVKKALQEKEKKKKNKQNDKKKKQEDKKKNKQDKKNDKKKQQDKQGDKKKKQQDEKKNGNKDSEKEPKDKKKKSQEKAKKDAAKELKKPKQNKEQNMQDMTKKMSDAEEKKWLKALKKKQHTYLYKLNKNKNTKDNSNEKPW